LATNSVRLIVTWIGGRCDVRTTLTLEPTLALAPLPRQGCQAVYRDPLRAATRCGLRRARMHL